MAHPLETLLQFLVIDSSSVFHLSYILDHLSPSCLGPSPHLQKWTTRVTSLMHSKDPAARWAGICIAHRMSFLSSSLLIDNAQSWVGIVLPSLSRPEPIPVLRASMRYLSLVLCAAGRNTEFQKQVAMPIVPKVSSTLLSIAEKHNNQDIKILSIRTLAQLVPLYPALHKALNQKLFALCNQLFNGTEHRTAHDLLDSTANLYAILHCLGGKVGGVSFWRNCLDEVLLFSWSAWLALQTTFPASAQLSNKFMAHLRSSNGKLLIPADAVTSSPLTTVALNLDRLNIGLSAIIALLRTTVSRPIKLPIGVLANFCWCLLASTQDDERQAHFDPHTRVAESTVVPLIWMQACRLLSCLAETARDLFAPHVSKLITIISSHLENDNLEHSQKHVFLRCAHELLYFCPIVGAMLGINRLLKVTISILSPLYLYQPRTEANSGPSSQSKVGKKRRREYEADSVLSVNNIAICTTTNECATMLAALDVVGQCLLSVELPASTRSLASRILLSIHLSLPSTPSSTFSPDPNFHRTLVRKVREMCVESVHGVSHAMSKGTGLVLRSLSSEGLGARDVLHSRVDLLLHPRRPPLVRTLPFLEALSLSSAEESTDETVIRHSLGLTFGDGNIHSNITEPQEPQEPVRQTASALDQQVPFHLPQNRALLASLEPSPPLQTTSDVNGDFPMETVIPSAAQSSVPKAPAGTSLSLPPEGLVSKTLVPPMLVDESDHEEVPEIDLGSDSDVD